VSFCVQEARAFFNYKGKVGRANAFLIKFIPTLSLQLKKARASHM
jgi:hypothetical protein